MPRSLAAPLSRHVARPQPEKTHTTHANRVGSFGGSWVLRRSTRETFHVQMKKAICFIVRPKVCRRAG